MKFFWSQSSENSVQSEQGKVDYSTYSKDELLDTFKTENWEKLDDENRIAIVQEMENRTAVEQGRPPAEIVSSYDVGTYQRNSEFEPFFGMNEMQVVLSLRQLAYKLNYSVTPRFERVVKAHLSILKELNIPISLSGLNYLCQFYDIGEFHENIMALPCGEAISRRIWADLGIDSEDSNSQFDLFRAVISNLSHDASRGGWNDNNCVAEFNCLQAIRQNATLLLSVNDMYSEMLLPYLAEELKAVQTPFVLIIDDAKIADEHFQEYLRLTNSGCYCGIIAENVVDLISGDEDNFLRLTERINTFIILKHSTGKTATVLSEIFGRYDYTKVETSQGTNRGFFSFLPRDRHDDVRFSTENRYRVMPEEIIGLRAGQAIVFDTSTDQIIRYN